MGFRGIPILLVMAGLGCSKGAVVRPQDSRDARPDFLPIVVAPDASPAPPDVVCTRSVNLQGISITRPVPFDVVIVADNTDSLSWSRDSLSSGLKNLLARVHGHDARFFVLTTTQYGASSQAAVSPITGKDIVSWRDSVSRTPFANEVTAYQQDCTDGKGATRACPQYPSTPGEAWRVKGSWKFTMPAPVAAISPDMDDAAIATEQKRIADAVVALGAGGGSEQEQPVCTLLRYLGQDAKALPKHAMFVVITDEDDTSPPAVCQAGYDAWQQVNTSPSVLCDSNCASYAYLAHKTNQELSLGYTCLPTDDKGTTNPAMATQKTLMLETVSQCAGDAGSSLTIDCSNDELTKASIDCGAGNVVQNCQHNCVVGKTVVQCNLTRTDNKTDICTQAFDWDGTRYTNLADYCSRKYGAGRWSCEIRGLNPAPPDAGTYTTNGEANTTMISWAKNTADMIGEFKNSANRLIGASNYSIATIVLDPAFNCPVKAGQSYATNLRTLASSSRDVFPLCEDYAPAIARISDFADYLIQTTFPLALDEFEAVDSVVVTSKQGQQRTVPASSYRYDDKVKQLIFSSGALTAQDDSLSVNVARECHRIIR